MFSLKGLHFQFLALVPLQLSEAFTSLALCLAYIPVLWKERRPFDHSAVSVCLDIYRPFQHLHYFFRLHET
jgi:hypothetical protein